MSVARPCSVRLGQTNRPIAGQCGAELLPVDAWFCPGRLFEESREGGLAVDPGDGEVDFVVEALE